MKRTMFRSENPSQTFEVAMVATTVNGWEYFFNEWHPKGDDVHFALVDGFEMEMGDVSLNEIKNYLLTVGSPWSSLPARGWEWAPYDDDFNEEIDD